MTRHSYRGRDYTFGQVMLKLRSSIGLTQAGLAHLLGVSRRVVGEWEAGSNYPKAEHLQHLIELCVQQHVFARLGSGRRNERRRVKAKEATKPREWTLERHQELQTAQSDQRPLTPAHRPDGENSPAVDRPNWPGGSDQPLPTRPPSAE
jgi:transcriptional regulator with XRE-family HTH domain